MSKNSLYPHICPTMSFLKCISFSSVSLLLSREIHAEGRSCMSFLWFSTDVNECEVYRLDQGGKLCVHECVNVPGSYHCSCPSGYKLLPDRRSCEGEWQDGTKAHSQDPDLAACGASERNICDLEGREASSNRALSYCSSVAGEPFLPLLYAPLKLTTLASGMNDLTVSQ